MEHIIIETLENGLLRLRAEKGYRLYNEVAQRFYSEAIVESAKNYKAIP